MRFKIDSNLEIVASAMTHEPKPVETVAVELCWSLINSGMVDQDPDNIGCTVIEATGPRYVHDICRQLAGYLYFDQTKPINCDVFDAFCRLVIIGDGDCPDCGGTMELIEERGHEKSNGYYIPPDFIVEEQEYRCPVCGKTIIKYIEK